MLLGTFVALHNTGAIVATRANLNNLNNINVFRPRGVEVTPLPLDSLIFDPLTH